MKKNRNQAAIRPQLLPAPGARVGSVDGPGRFPADRAGTVLCHITDRWGTHATVLWDDGHTGAVHGITSVGIGVHLIAGQVRPVGFTLELEAGCVQHDLRICVAPGTDLDCTFLAWDLDANEFVSLNGWNWTFDKVDASAHKGNI